MDDQQIEQEIQAKGLTAPRITPADIEAVIVAEQYFTAEHGINGALVRGELYGGVKSTEWMGSLAHVTFCVLLLRNGTKVTGVNHGPVSAANFDAATGRQYARANAVEKVWELEGYALRSYLHAMKGPRTSYSTESLLEAIDDKAGKVELIPIQAIGLQPIDTAPTDGTVFLGYRKRDGRWGECYRVQRDDCEMWSFGGGSAAAEEFPDFKPTHWMPLPA